MGIGGSMYARKDGDVLWYNMDSEESRRHQDADTGYGQFREKSFREGAVAVPSVNRPGNERGELARKVVLFTTANRKTRYSPHSTDTAFDIAPDTKIFAKLFLSAPLGMTPIGENNLARKKHDRSEGAVNYKGFGPVLLAPTVGAIALFVVVDGMQKSYEIFCNESAKAVEAELSKDENADDDEDEDCAPLVTSAISGSFVTFPLLSSQLPFFFLHFPILANHDACTKVGTGPYALTVAQAFQRLFLSLSPGKHAINIMVQAYYNHKEFRYFVRDFNLNSQGVWLSGLPNECLKSPHPEPLELTSPDSTIGEGFFMVNVPSNFAVMFEGMLDRKPPPERYKDDDIDTVRKEAGLVAMGRFVQRFDVQGLPDITVLMSKKIDLHVKDKKQDYRHSYEYIEFATCWLNASDSSPTAIGVMILGAMAKGEVKPKDYSQTWTWHKVTRGGVEEEPEPLAVKNKYILARMIERRRSQNSLFTAIKAKVLKK